MPTPVFGGGSQAVTGVLKAENVKLTGWGGKGAIVQQVQLSFERTMNMLYEIGSQNVYFLATGGEVRFKRSVLLAARPTSAVSSRSTAKCVTPARTRWSWTPLRTAASA